MARFCPKCGTETNTDDSFCHNCGAKLPSSKVILNKETEIRKERTRSDDYNVYIPDRGWKQKFFSMEGRLNPTRYVLRLFIWLSDLRKWKRVYYRCHRIHNKCSTAVGIVGVALPRSFNDLSDFVNSSECETCT